MSCIQCGISTQLCCSECQISQAKPQIENLKNLQAQIESSARSLPVRKPKSLKLETLIEEKLQTMKSLQEVISQRESDIAQIKDRIGRQKVQLESVKRRSISQGIPSNIFSMNESDFSQLPLMHPLRKLKSMATSLQDLRRAKCQQFLNIFPGEENLVDLPTSEMVSEVLINYSCQILILWSLVLDVALPFPLGLGSQISDETLSLPESAAETGTYVNPRLFHRSLNRLVILDSRIRSKFALNMARKMVTEDADYLMSFFGCFNDTRTNLFDALSKAVTQESFGLFFARPKLKQIDQNVIKDEKIIFAQHEGGDWAFLDAQ